MNRRNFPSIYNTRRAYPAPPYSNSTQVLPETKSVLRSSERDTTLSAWSVWSVWTDRPYLYDLYELKDLTEHPQCCERNPAPTLIQHHFLPETYQHYIRLKGILLYESYDLRSRMDLSNLCELTEYHEEDGDEARAGEKQRSSPRLVD